MDSLTAHSPQAAWQQGFVPEDSPAPSGRGKLSLAVYYPWIYLTSGAERTILEYSQRSQHHVTVFTNEYQAAATFPGFCDVDMRLLSKVSVKRSVSVVAGVAWRLLRQPLDLAGFDALLVVCEGLGDLVALRPLPVPVLCLCLTPLRLAFDPVYRTTYLRNKSIFHRAVIAFGTVLYRRVDRLAWRRYRRIFPISNEVRGRIMAGRLAPASRLEVIHPGIDLSAYSPSSQTERTFFVPGRIMWTKNIELAIEAFKLFRQSVADGSSWRLRIAGIVDRKSEPYLDRLRALASGDDAVEFVIHPSDQAMFEHYRSCFATLFTAFNEDWGLVMIEALASGKPVVATDRGGPREIIMHGYNGLLAEPCPGKFAQAMVRLATEPGLRDSLAAHGPASARRFGWQPFVERLDQAIEWEVRESRLATARHPAGERAEQA